MNSACVFLLISGVIVFIHLSLYSLRDVQYTRQLVVDALIRFVCATSS